MNAQLISCYKIQGRPRQNSKSQFLSSQHWDYFYCATENGAKSISTTTRLLFSLDNTVCVQQGRGNKGFADKISGTRDVI